MLRFRSDGLNAGAVVGQGSGRGGVGVGQRRQAGGPLHSRLWYKVVRWRVSRLI